MADTAAAVSAGPLAVALKARSVGVLPALAGLPDPVVVLAALVTQLGDPWFVFALLLGLYWRPAAGLSRHDAAALLALLATTALLVTAFKAGLALPRPPGAAQMAAPGWLPWPLDAAFVDTASATDFGVPSGHATAATVLYGGLAALATAWSRRRRVLVAVVLVVVISGSRLVLGLHYLVDLVAGWAVGLALLGLFLRAAGRQASTGPAAWETSPGRWFLLAAVTGSLAAVVAASGGHLAEVHEAVLGTGAALGGLVGWRFTSRGAGSPSIAGTDALPATPHDGPVPIRIALATGVVAGGLWGASYWVTLPLVVAGIGSGVSFAVALGVPGALDRRRRSDSDPDRETG